MGTDHGVYLHGYLSTLALGRRAKFIKVPLLVRRPWPNCVRLEWEADDEEIHPPPTTHLIATVDDLTDTLDFDSEDINGMDDDDGEEQEPPPTGRWTATSSYDVYMVDTPKRNNNEDRKNANRDRSPEKQSKW